MQKVKEKIVTENITKKIQIKEKFFLYRNGEKIQFG